MTDVFAAVAPRKLFHWLFDIGVVLKGINGILEMIGGLFLLFISQPALAGFFLSLTQGALSQEPHGFIANFLLHIAQNLSIQGKLFAALYLLFHGTIKVALVVYLLRGKLRAYPISMLIFGLFVVYELYRFSSGHSVFLLTLAIFDAIIILLIWLEYRVRLKRQSLLQISHQAA